MRRSDMQAIASVGAMTRPQFRQMPTLDLAGALDNFYSARDAADKRAKNQAYIDALQGGDQDQINKAWAAYDPQSFASFMQNQAKREEDRQWALDDLAAQRDFQREMQNIMMQKAFALEDKKYQNAISLKELEQRLKGESAEDAASLKNAQDAVNLLYDISQNGNVGAWTRQRQKLGLASDQQETELGQISGAIAAIAPRAIARLKAAGVSGVNTLGEFMTYVGLPQDATSKQIAGALPMIAQVAGVELPKGKEVSVMPQGATVNYAAKYGLDIPNTTKENVGLAVNPDYSLLNAFK